jgi:8-oxo-dGTP diphosphatase
MMTHKPTKFNVRVYGIWISDGKVLVTDELRGGKEMTKFPGGGLEFGEGPVDCILRECIEEFGQEFEVTGHFYTTDFFQQSAFNRNDQLLSIYYLIKPVDDHRFKISGSKFDFAERIDGAQAFRWIPLSELSPADLTFPVDRKVAEMLKQNNLL